MMRGDVVVAAFDGHASGYVEEETRGRGWCGDGLERRGKIVALASFPFLLL
jgi:hypothetical protein